MIKIIAHNEIDRAEWERLVKMSATGTWFQSPDAYDFFTSMPELFRPFAFGVENKGSLRGTCSGYITVEKSALKQFMTRRAIIIGGPCFADDCTDEEVQTLMEAVREQPILNPFLKERTSNRSSLQGRVGKRLLSPIYIETRNFNDYSKWRAAFEASGFAYQPHLNFHVDTSSVEVVEANLGKSRKRDIRTSFRDGAVIIDLGNERISELEKERMVHEYYLILKNLYETKVKTPLFPESFFQTLAKHQDGRFLLVAIPKEDRGMEIIGGTVCVEQAGKCVYEWFACGRDGEWKSIFPSCVATYAGIKYAAEHNMPRFDMMGAGKPDEAYGVRDFKAKFGGQEVEHGRFLFITKPLLYKIGLLGVKLLKKLK